MGPTICAAVDMIESPGARITLRSYRPVISRLGRGVAWASLPWALFVLFGTYGVLGWSDDQPLVVRIFVVAVALAPGLICVACPWLPRVPGIRRLLADPQPEATLDPDGIRLVLPSRPVQRFQWSEVASLAPSNDLRGSSSLLAPGGNVLATVPSYLVAPGGPGPRSLAEAVVSVRPDRYVLTPGGMHSLTPWFDLRDRAVSIDARYDPRRSRNVAVLLVVTFLVVVGVLAAILWISSSP